MADRTRKKHQRKWKWYAKNVQRSTTLTERYNRSFYRIFVVAPRETIFDPNNEKHRPPPLFGISLCKEKRRKKKKRKRTKKRKKTRKNESSWSAISPARELFFFFFFFYTFHSFIDLWFIFSLRKFSERNFNETRRLKKKKTILYNKKKSEKIRRLSSVETEKRKKKKERRKKRKRIQFFDFVARP